MNLLQIPIVDEFHIASPIEAKKRGSDFAAQKGFFSAVGARRAGAPIQPSEDAAAGDSAGGAAGQVIEPARG